MSAKLALFKALDRPGLRWALDPIATVFVSATKRQWCVVRREGPLFLHHYDGAVLVQPAVGGDDPAGRDTKTRDDFFYDHTPGPGDTVLDVGAGIGGEALTFSKLVGPNGRVVCIEGHPATAHALRRLVELNHLENVTVLPLAVGQQAGLVFMSDDTVDHLGNSVRGDADSGPAVPVLPLDLIIADLGLDRVDFLKMNIEGAEVDALNGMSANLASVGHVAISCHDFLADAGADDAVRTRAPVESLLCDNGFDVVHRIDRRPWLADTLYGSNAAATER